ncbi:MAG: hypothetical protein BJ554DRAFT_4830, partial [Olpidium bornovanus]
AFRLVRLRRRGPESVAVAACLSRLERLGFDPSKTCFLRGMLFLSRPFRWRHLGVNLDQFSGSFSTMVPVVGFFCSLCGMMVVIFTYWISVTLFPTLIYLSILGLLAAVSGRQMLANMARVRLGTGRLRKMELDLLFHVRIAHRQLPVLSVIRKSGRRAAS